MPGDHQKRHFPNCYTCGSPGFSRVFGSFYLLTVNKLLAVSMCMYAVHMPACMCWCMETRATQVVALSCCPPWFLRQGLSDPELTDLLSSCPLSPAPQGWGSRPRSGGLACLLFVVLSACLFLFCLCLRNQSRVLILPTEPSL